MATQLDIINKALRHIGAESVSALTDTSPRFLSIYNNYATARDAVLEDGNWGFAKTRVAIVKDAVAPAFEYSYRFAKPAGFIKLIKEYNDAVVVEEGAYFLSDETSLQIIYVVNTTLEATWSAGFVSALSLRLALESGIDITQDKALYQLLDKKYQEELDKSRRNNSLNSEPDHVEPTTFLGGRGGSW
jgi:hypothetical protein